MCYEMQKNENNTKRVKVSTIFGLNNTGYKGIFFEFEVLMAKMESKNKRETVK